MIKFLSKVPWGLIACGIMIFGSLTWALWQAGHPKNVEDEVLKMDLRELKQLRPPPGI